MNEYNLIFFNTGESKESGFDFGNRIDPIKYEKGTLYIKIGSRGSYDKNIKPNLEKGIYRENQYDFISIVQLEDSNKILGALVTAEPSRSNVVKINISCFKKNIKKQYNKGLISAEIGFDEYNKSFSKYFWSLDIINNTNIYDWKGNKPRLSPLT